MDGPVGIFQMRFLNFFAPLRQEHIGIGSPLRSSPHFSKYSLMIKHTKKFASMSSQIL